MIVYKITNLINSKVYIGQTVKAARRRFGQHISGLKLGTHANPYLLNSFAKYGIDNFKFEELDKCVFKWSLDSLERFWIDHHKSTDRNFGYNVESGGNLKKTFASKLKGTKMKESLRLKLSQVKKNKQLYKDIAYLNCKKVAVVAININTNKVMQFKSYRECATALGVSNSAVRYHIIRQSNLLSKQWKIKSLT